MSDRARAIVIGSGFGGLAAAVRLGAKGYDVTVLEKLDAPGGRAYVYRQDGFVFDAGPTIITAPFLLEELWTLCGKTMSDDIDLRELSPYYTIRFDDGSHFDYSGDDEAMKREIARFNPADVEGYERFLKASAKLYDIGFDQLLYVSFDSIGKMFKVLPKLVDAQFYRSVHSVVSRYIKHPKLRRVFSFHPLLIGGNPYSASAVYTLISHLEREGGVYSAMGGTGRIVDGLAKLIEHQGNVLRCNAPVQEICVRDRSAHGVVLEGGEYIGADLVVSNADVAWTYRHLTEGTVRRRWSDRRLNRASYSNGLFVWYFGTRRRYVDVPHHSILLGPRYRGLLNDIFRHKRLAEDFSLYLHRPTATDPSLAPEGCDAFYVLAPVPNLEADVDWEQQAEPFRCAVQQYLAGSVLPDLENQLASSLVTTPLDFQGDLNSFRGAGFGMEPVLWQSAWFRPHNRSEDVKGLFFVGAGTHPGAGVPGVIASAKVVEELVPDASALV